jgi:6-phosphogluconolactonase (cycloisomerase 2 family)
MDAVYLQTNDADGNRVLAFRRLADGRLVPLRPVETGGRGSGAPHLPSQGSVALAGADRLLVTNAGSDEVTLLAIREDGAPERLQTVASGGRAPRSVAVHGDLVYVLNAADATLAGFRLAGERLEPLAGSRRALGPDADPAQAGFSPDGSKLVVTERGADAIAVFPVAADGLLGAPATLPSSGPTPYGFSFAGDGTLVVTEAFRAERGLAAASSYALGNGSPVAVSRSVGNGRSEICWAVVSPDGRWAFTTNFADGAVSRYAIHEDGSITLDDATAGLAVDGEKGLRDEDLSADGRFLYAVDADARRILGWEVAENGALTPLGSWDGLPATVAGLAAT